MSDELLKALMVVEDELNCFQPGNYFDEENEAIAFEASQKNCLELLQVMTQFLNPSLPIPTDNSDLPF